MDLSGKVVIVTGGARGLGKAVCEGFLNSKAKVCFADVQEDTAKDTLKEFIIEYGEKNVLFKQCDVSSKTSFEGVFKAAKDAYGHVDTLICCAGILNEEDWDKTIDVNLRGCANGYALATKYMGKEISSGAVVFVASVAGIEPAPEIPIYSATKAALVSLAKTLGHSSRYKVTGIRVNAVCPAVMETEMASRLANYIQDTTDVTAEIIEEVGMVSVSEVANAVLELIKDGSTAKVISVTKKGVRDAIAAQLFRRQQQPL